MAYVKTSVDKPGLNKGAGGDKLEKIIIFDMDDLLVANTFPARDSKGIVIAGNIAFKPATYMITVYATSSSVKVSSNSEGEQDAEGFVHDISFDHPGNEMAIREFRQNWLSKNVGIIVQHCSSTKKDLLGTPCSPLRGSVKFEDDKDKTKTTFTFKSALKCPYDIADYQGTVAFDTVRATLAANAVSIDLTNGEGQYQLTTGTVSAVAINAATNAADGITFTLLGSGGTYPSTIATGGVFELSNGTSWSAIANATITFRAFKNGASSWKYIEVSRT
jgi:hypothetical protein